MEAREKERIKAIAFDIDGTLYPRREMYLRLFLSSLADIPFSLKYNAMRKKIRKEDGTERKIVTNRRDLLKRESLLMYKTEDKEDLFIKKEAKQNDRWAKAFSSLKPYEGMKEALVRASEKYTLALLSDFPLLDKDRVLAIDNLISFKLSSEESGALKPAASPFLLLLERLSLDAECVLFVGDSEDKDIRGAKSVGMRTALLSRCDGKKSSNADIIFRTWKEFQEEVL